MSTGVGRLKKILLCGGHPLIKTLLKQFLMKLWATGTITDRETELMIHFFKVEES
jgi:hypothetical protein